MNRAATIYSGGFGHEFGETSAHLARLAAVHGWNPTIASDVSDMVAALAETGLLVVNALRWSMTQADRYAPHRERWAGALTAGQFDAIDGFVTIGGSLLVVHTGTICWDTTPGWRRVLGGAWTWGRSHHPPLGPVAVALTGPGRAFSSGPDEFTLIDEAYHDLDPSPDCTILATAAVDAGPQPVVWTRRHARGRVGVDALGHDTRSLGHPGHAALLAGLFAWLQGRATDATD